MRVQGRAHKRRYGHVLSTFLRYHREQGLSPWRLAPEDLFAPESFSAARI